MPTPDDAAALEQRVAELEARIAHLEARLAEPPIDTRIKPQQAAKYLARSTRSVEDLIRAGVLDAIDTRKPGAKRAHWSISLASLRRFLADSERKEREQRMKDATARENVAEPIEHERTLTA